MSDTRRAVLDGHLGPYAHVRPYVEGEPRVTELRARARRANAIVRHREHPERPEPEQRVHGPNGRMIVVVVDPERDVAIAHEPDLWQMPTSVWLGDLVVVSSWT